jgi:hypothetical protein
MMEINGTCPLCDKPTENAPFAEKICSLCGMSIGDSQYYMFAGAGTQHYFCSSKCVKTYLIGKEIMI